MLSKMFLFQKSANIWFKNPPNLTHFAEDWETVKQLPKV